MGADSIENMIKTIVMTYHWRLGEILQMSMDRDDIEGLEYWYQNILDTAPKVENK